MWVPKKKEAAPKAGFMAYPPGLGATPGGAAAEEASDASSSDESSASSSPETKDSKRGAIRMAFLPRSAKRLIAPLDVRFSQMKMRHLFGDGRRVAAAVAQIKAIRVSDEEAAENGAPWKLQVPFPTIEIIRWRAKIRDEDGRPKVNGSGEELLDSRAHWFTLDNRRLYCLQEAALLVWPERCVVEVAEVKTGPQANIMELRKFRTLDRGRSIKIGSQSDGVPFVRWSWRAKVGLSDGGASSDSSGPDVAERHSKLVKERGKVWDAHVLDHLETLKQDDYDRIEVSKKLSYILRRGASALDVQIDDDGWVKVADLLEVEFLGHISAAALLDVIDQSNKQKKRYELKVVNDELYVRASTKRGTNHAATRREKSRIFDGEKPWEAANSKAPAEKGRGKTAAGRGSKDADSDKIAEKGDKSAAKLAGKGAPGSGTSRHTEKLKEERGNTELDNARPSSSSKTKSGSSKAVSVEGAQSLKAANSAAAAKAKAAGAAAAAAAAQGPAAMQAFYKNLAAMQAMAMRPPMPMRPPSTQQMQQMHAMRHMHMMQQMQAMQAFYFQYQVQMQQQLAAIGQMRAMRQHAAMARMNDHMQAMQQMESLMKKMQAVQDGGTTTADESDDDEEEDAEEGSGSERDLQSRIAEVLEEARKRSVKMNASATPFMPAGLMYQPAVIDPELTEEDEDEDDEGEEEAEEEEEEHEPEAPPDIQSKIAQALDAARARSGVTQSAAPPSQKRTPAAKTSAAASIDAKIAEALEAAKARSGAVAAAAKPPPRPIAQKSPVIPEKEGVEEDIQSKIAEALQAARARNSGK